MGRARRKRKAKIMYIKFSLLILLIILAVLLIKNTFAKYKSNAISNANVDLAYYLFKEEDISQDLKLESILPREDPYNYRLKVANYDGEKRTETAIKYTIEIKATTNLPLNFNLYNEQNPEVSLGTSTETKQDSDGTYFKYINFSGGNFGFRQNEESYYILEVEFPKEYNLAQYEGIVEYIQITLKSEQKIQ